MPLAFTRTLRAIPIGYQGDGRVTVVDDGVVVVPAPLPPLVPLGTVLPAPVLVLPPGTLVPSGFKTST
jgi:hypothetical protein